MKQLLFISDDHHYKAGLKGGLFYINLNNAGDGRTEAEIPVGRVVVAVVAEKQVLVGVENRKFNLTAGYVGAGDYAVLVATKKGRPKFNLLVGFERCEIFLPVRNIFGWEIFFALAGQRLQLCGTRREL